MKIISAALTIFLAALVVFGAGLASAKSLDRPSEWGDFAPPVRADQPGGAVCFYCARDVNPVVEKWKSRKRSLETERLRRTDGHPESRIEFMIRTFF